MTEQEWREKLSPEQYAVLRNGTTERAGTGRYAHVHDSGTYRCAACAADLFDAADKYESGTGWPSFTRPTAPDAVSHVRETSLLGRRTEVRCHACASHLGHVFQDGPAPTGNRYCMNSISLELISSAPSS